MPSLPTNIDASYPDDAGDPSVVAHQGHHDVVHAALNKLGYVDETPNDGDGVVWNAATSRWVKTAAPVLDQDQLNAAYLSGVIATKERYPGLDPTGATYSDVGLANFATDIAAEVTAGSSTTGLSGSTNTSGGAPKAILPPGIYKLSAAWDWSVVSDYVHLSAWGAILIPDTGIDAITGLSYRAFIEGLIVRGGRRHFSLATGNADTTKVHFRGVQCDSPSEAMFYDDGASASTILTVEDSILIQRGGATAVVADLNSVTHAIFNDNWVTANGDYVFDVSGGTTLYLNDNLAVPQNTSGAWVKVTANSSVIARGNRWGGESGGKTLVESRATPDLTNSPAINAIDLDNETHYAASKPVINFYDLPNQTKVGSIKGVASVTALFRFDATIPNASKLAIGGGRVGFSIDGRSHVWRPGLVTADSDAHTVQALLASLTLRDEDSAFISVGDVKYTRQGGDGDRIETRNNCTGANGTGLNGEITRVITATANNANVIFDWAGALVGLPAGIYTAIATFEVQTGYANLGIQASDRIVEEPAHLGRHVLCVPFYFDGGTLSDDDIAPRIWQMPAGAVVEFSAVRVVAGRVRVDRGPALVLHGEAAPTAGRHMIGDRVEDTTPTAGGTAGWINTALADPGTWKTYGVISA